LNLVQPRLINTCLNETYSELLLNTCLSDTFAICQKIGDICCLCCISLLRNVMMDFQAKYKLREVKEKSQLLAYISVLILFKFIRRKCKRIKNKTAGLNSISLHVYLKGWCTSK